MSTIILANAHILTMNRARPVARDLIISDGRILDIRRQTGMWRVGPGVRVYYLEDRTVAPGFNDCHMHILPYGLYLGQADLSPSAGVNDVTGLVAALRRWCSRNPGSEWALGNRYDQNRFPGAAHPTRQDLDAAFPERPVYVVQTSGHAGAANSVALRLAGVTRETPDPEGGEIVRDAAGEPTGVLLESAIGLVTRHIPRPDRAGLVAAIRRANDALVRAGITSASDLNTGWFDMEAEIACYRQAAEEGAPVRMTLFPHAPAFGKPEDVPSRSAFLQGWRARDGGNVLDVGLGGVRIGPIKLFSDGALTVRTAALREPYIDGSGVGMLLHAPDELQEYIWEAHRKDWQVAVHAIGDRAIELVLDCYRTAQQRMSRRDARHRIEHAMLLDAGLIRRFAKEYVIPVVQPEFVARLGDAYVMGLGLERAARLNPTKSLERAGIGVPFSSDCPIVPGAPLDGIRAAARRTTPGGTVLGAGERIAPLHGLRNYTYWSAYSTFDEAETGTIERGKRADLTILDGVLTEETLDTVKVAATVVAGQVVYGAEALDRFLVNGRSEPSRLEPA